MPNASPPSPLPPLSDFESSLISSFLILRYDLVALAETSKLNPRQLLAFAQSAAVQAHLAELRKFADLAFALRAHESRNLALNLLEEVATSTADPIEKRRAASAILRGLNPPGGTRVGRASGPPSSGLIRHPATRGTNAAASSAFHTTPNTSSNNPSSHSSLDASMPHASMPSSSSPPMPASAPPATPFTPLSISAPQHSQPLSSCSSPSLGRGAAPVDCQGRKLLENSPASQAPEGRHPSPPNGSSPIHLPTCSPVPTPSTSHRLTPSPSHPLTPDAVIKLAIAALTSRDLPTLERLLAPDSIIDPRALLDLCATLPLSSTPITNPTPQHPTLQTFTLTFPDSSLHLTLTRASAGPNPNSWLLADACQELGPIPGHGNDTS